MSDITPVKLKGIIKWASVTTPVENYNKDGKEFKVDVECTQEQLDKLIKMGISNGSKVKFDEEFGKTFLTIRKPSLTADGKPTSVTVVDSKLKPFTGKIGNGTVANVSAILVKLKHPKAGVTHCLRLNAIQVLDLVEYSGNGGLDFEVEDGYSVSGEGPDDLEVFSDQTGVI